MRRLQFGIVVGNSAGLDHYTGTCNMGRIMSQMDLSAQFL